MINSINSNSDYLSLQSNNNLLYKLSSTTGTSTQSSSFKISTDDSTVTTASSSSDSSVLSLEDLLGMMQSFQKPSTISTETEQTSTKGDLGNIDTDGDGTLSSDEYDSMISQMGIEDALSADEFFSQFDTDSDGEITQAEMDASRPMGPPPEENQSISSDIDTDGNGTISVEEYEAAMAQAGTSDTISSEDFFAQFDTDSDGEVSIEELNAQKPTGPPPMGMPPEASDETASSQSTSTQTLSKELKNLAANTLSAYETNYQYMFGSSANLGSIA